MNANNSDKVIGVVAKIIIFALLIFFGTLSMIQIDGPGGEAWLNQHPVFKFFYCFSHFLGGMAGCAG